MSVPDFLVHDDTDTVGVVVVEGIQSGQKLNGLVMTTDEEVTILSQDPIPLGHKVALRDIKNGNDIIKYDNAIGKAIADIEKGGHVHIHNVKTKRW